MSKWMQGKFTLKNPQKYVGLKEPTYRSSWEFAFFNFCDNNPHVLNWASESIKIPYRNPLTGKNTVYVPDVLVVYQDKNGNKRAELVEIKPSNQMTVESAGNNQRNKLAAIINIAKWQAAEAYCNKIGLKFRVINESHIFKQGNRK